MLLLLLRLAIQMSCKASLGRQRVVRCKAQEDESRVQPELLEGGLRSCGRGKKSRQCTAYSFNKEATWLQLCGSWHADPNPNLGRENSPLPPVASSSTSSVSIVIAKADVRDLA